MGSGFERGLAQSACQGPRWTNPGLPRHNDRSEIDSREYVRLSKIGDTVMSLKKIGWKRVVSLDGFLPDRLSGVETDCTAVGARCVRRGTSSRQVATDRGLSLPSVTLSNGHRKQKLVTIRSLLGARTPAPKTTLSAAEWLETVLGIDPMECPCCGGRLQDDEIPRPPMRASLSFRPRNATTSGKATGSRAPPRKVET